MVLVVVLAVAAVVAFVILRRKKPVASAADDKWCTFCEREVHEVVRLVSGPFLRFAGEDDRGVHIHICCDCVAVIEEMFAAEDDSGGEKKAGPDGGPHCSFCAKGHLDVRRMALGARFYRVGGEVKRVVHHTLFMNIYGDRSPELVAELYICDACIALTREIIDEDRVSV